MSNYANPESLVSTQWIADHLNNPHFTIVEVIWGSFPAYSMSLYESGHIRRAVVWDYEKDGQADRWGVLDKDALEASLSRIGVLPETTIILYSDLQNLLATYVFWLLKVFGHQDVRLLDGGRQKWVDENRPMTREKPLRAPTKYLSQNPDWTLRVSYEDILQSLGKENRLLVDARSNEMYCGLDKAGMKHGGHIPGAINFPAQRETNPDGTFKAWRVLTVRPDGTFKSAQELQALLDNLGITPDKEIITYCLRGGLSTHAWFVMTQLLGYHNVREYDRSWSEWGNLEGVPVEQ